MTAEIIPINRRQEQAWDEYISARSIAESSGSMDDGIAAGRAWRKWIDLFLTDDQRHAMSAPVSVMRR